MVGSPRSLADEPRLDSMALTLAGRVISFQSGKRWAPVGQIGLK